MPELTLQPIADEDLEFLAALYASTRAEELAGVDWSDEQKAAFLQQQFSAQHWHYQQHYTGARFDLVLVDGEKVGRLYVARWTNEIRLIDISFLPEARNRGIGTRLIRELMEEGEAAGKAVSIHVEMFNPAQRLYRRLGFQPIDEFGVYHLMEWRPASAGPREAGTSA